ncbi:MAG: flagellar motor protein MotA [Rhodospirillaceae bacterium]|nr:flagellar motor protein MotA [Rhodospirillaceae bacterium]MBT7761108.1 flagellar motor protein MotA [Rhodospirillaceae bacterium]
MPRARGGGASLTTVIGLLSGFALIAAAMFWGGSPASFFDGPALLIVFGGTFAVTLSSFSLTDMGRAAKAVGQVIMRRSLDPGRAAFQVVELAERARSEGVIGLQDRIAKLKSDPFLMKAMMLVADGTPGETVESILRREVDTNAGRQQTSADVFRKVAEISPAMGLIGTLVGLVQMLGNLNDPSTIGPAMAIALLTTFYGAVLANMVFAPLATKLERSSDGEVLVQNVYLVGAGSIGRQENPRRLEMLLNAMLPPSHRIQYYD